MRIISAWVGLLLLGMPGAMARPVSYQGGLTLITEQDRDMRAAIIHFTPHPRFSAGLRREHHLDDEIDVTAVQGTYLVRRWSGPDHQANIYVTAALGTAEVDAAGGSSSGTARIAELLADWETRRYFVGYRGRLADLGVETPAGPAEGGVSALRAGVAPYLGDTGDLHSWLMLDVSFRPEAEEEVGIAPMLRLFKGPALLEIGWSVTDDVPVGSFIYRF